MKIIFLSALLLTAQLSFAQNPLVGKTLPNLILEGDDGGRLDGTKWSLKQTLRENKVTVIYYVDPDEKDKNEEISERFKEKSYSLEKIQFLGMINMDATWLPNFAISESLKSKQRKYPDTLYLKDYTKKGVKTWAIADDENNIILLDRTGKVLFAKFGKVTKEEGDKMLALIEKLIAKP